MAGRRWRWTKSASGIPMLLADMSPSMMEDMTLPLVVVDGAAPEGGTGGPSVDGMAQ